MATTPEEALASMIANMPEKTGKSLAEWVQLAAGAKADKHGLIVKYLKSEQGLTHGYANLVAHKFLEAAAPAAEEVDLLTAQYAEKGELRSIYDALAEAISKFGPDVDFSQKKAYVSLRRSKQFALIQPTTKTRMDIGINLKGEPTTERLEASGSFNAMVSHRVRLSSTAEVDAELIAWLKLAYERA